MTRLLLATLALALTFAGCASAATAIRPMATWACRYQVTTHPRRVEMLPKDQDSSRYVRGADLAYIRKRWPGREGKDEAASRASLSAFTRASAEAAICAVQKVRVTGTKADATVMATYRIVGDPTNVAYALRKLHSDAERLAEARKLFRHARPGKPHAVVMHFVKTPSGWRASLGLPEKAQRKVDRRRASKCEEAALYTAITQVSAGQFERASAMLARLRACAQAFVTAGGDPEEAFGHELLAPLLEAVEHEAVPEHWQYQEHVDKTDGTTVTVIHSVPPRALPGKLPGVDLECHEGAAELTFRGGRLALPDSPPTDEQPRDFLLHRFWYLPVKVQLDGSKPLAVKGVVKESHPGVILPVSKAFVQKLGAASRLKIRWPAREVDDYEGSIHGVEAVTTLDVKGLRKKVRRFWARCGARTKLADAIAHRPTKWIYSVRVDREDGTIMTYLKLDPGRRFFGSGFPKLELRCHKGEAGAYFHPNSDTMIYGADSYLTVLEKFDDETPVEVRASTANADAPWRLPHPKAFIEKLEGTTHLALQWAKDGDWDSQESRAAWVFDVRGLDQKLGRFWSRCGMPAEAKVPAAGHKP